ncbi:hypothetical protein IFR05_013014 [Cadophora sp. M221]|nr:hypothetical protein IFR05_013014 [Cadophora sp. M221]
MNQQDGSSAPVAQSPIQSPTQSPPPPSAGLAMDESQQSPSAVSVPVWRPEQVMSRFSTDSSDHSPSTKSKPKSNFSFQLPMKRVSELLHSITGPMKQIFRLQKKLAQAQPQPQLQAQYHSQEHNPTLVQDHVQAQAEPQDQVQTQPPSTSPERPSSPRMTIFRPRPLSSSSTRSTSTSRPLSITPTQRTSTSSSRTTLVGSPTASTRTYNTSASTGTAITRVAFSATWDPLGARVVSSSSGATLRVNSAPEPVRSKVATRGKHDGVWICCICRKWTLTSSPKCVKCRATGEKKPHPEFWPCFHIKCAACEELTEWGRKDYELTGTMGTGRIVGELVREAGVPGGNAESGSAENIGGGGFGGWI